MKENLSLLISIQECDSQLVKLSARKTKLPEIISRLEEEFRAYKEKIEVNKRKFDELKARRAESETKVKRLNEGMVKTRERLLEVKNNKEYQAMLKEIETAEKNKSDIETGIIALMDEMDQLSVLVKQDEATLSQAADRHEAEKKSMQKDLSDVDADTASWAEKREGLQKSLPAELLAWYEKVKKRNNGIGVISVWKATCNGCHMNIPPQLYIDLQRSNELLSCPNCNRIMYFEDQEKNA